MIGLISVTPEVDDVIFDLDWYEVILESYRCTKSTPIRSFLYRFASRDLYANSRLYKMKLSNSPICLKCTKDPETIIHIFWNCPTASALWNQIIRWLEIELNIHIDRKPCTVLLNYIENDVIYWPVKQAIYGNKDNSTQVPFIQIKNIVRKTEQIEQQIAIAKKGLQFH